MDRESPHTTPTPPIRPLAALLGFLVPFCVDVSALFAQGAAGDGKSALGPGAPEPESALDFVMNFEVVGVDVWRLIAAIVIMVVGFAVRGFLFERLMKPFRDLLSQTETNLDNLILEKTKGPFSWFINMMAVYLGLRILDLPEKTLQSIDLVAKTVGTVLVAWMLFRVVDILVHALEGFTEDTSSEIDDQLVPVVRRILRFFLVTLTIFFIIQQWGYNVGSLLAGLGIGGLAFALAARKTLSNWFGALMIFTDRPFKVGEWVEVDEGQGTVEEVGLRSTRIRTYGRNQIVVPNSELMSMSVINKSVRDRRRIKADIRLVYDTGYETMNRVLGEIRTLLDEHDDVWDGDWRAYFVEFEQDALRIEVSCFTTDPDVTLWRETRQHLFLEIIRIVEEAGAEFAFPTRSVRFDDATDLSDAPEGLQEATPAKA